jgi:hypothetical protein
MKKLLTIGQRIALDHVLCEWPEDLYFETILNLIAKNNHERLTVWEQLEDWDSETLYQFIKGLAENIDHALKEQL